MSKFQQFVDKNKESLNSRTARVGAYNALLTILVLAVLVAGNVFVSLLPSPVTQYDISEQQLYSLTSSTRAIVGSLEQNVHIYWIVQNNQEDQVLEKLLSVYDTLSDKLIVERRNPDVYPTFAQRYTDEDVSNNSIIVEADNGKYEYIPFDKVYPYDQEIYVKTGQKVTSFNGEGAISGAIYSAVSDYTPHLYLTTGNGEKEFYEGLRTTIEQNNILVDELDLSTVDDIPEDADCILVYAPTRDLEQSSAKLLKDYMNNGGHVIVYNGLQTSGIFGNLRSMAEDFGAVFEEGMVIEGNQRNTEHYPYILVPEFGDSPVTNALIDDRAKTVVPIVQGITLDTSGMDLNLKSAHPLLLSTDKSFLKGEDTETYTKTEGVDKEGPFVVAFAGEYKVSEGTLVWVGSNTMLEEAYNNPSVGGNTDFLLNALSWSFGNNDVLAIRTRSLTANQLTITEDQANLMRAIVMIIVPLASLICGIVMMIHRRKKQ